MTLSTGTKLSHYEISSQLGKGGMGEVYKAKDQKLGRDVAIKVLPEEFAQDTDRVARFQREAKLLASLNHPNIAAIYGLEESDGAHFLVLELIEGDTLADRIKGGPIPVEESLKLALQIAEALEAAHEKGVIHRDLKPANIKVTPNGKVKVLDFGLAKAFAGEQAEMNLSHSPTLSNMATQQGVILGTAAYMSPEQARGKPVDKRTDIWAFGCVLYEMLTGKAAFQGEDVTEILAAVVKSGVNLDLLPANIHPRIREVIIRCLQKEQRKRYPEIGQSQYEIEQVLADPSGVFVQPSVLAKPKKRVRLGLSWFAAGIALASIIAGVAVWMLKPAPPPEPKRVTRFDYDLPEGQQFTRDDMGQIEAYMAVSPDGSQFVYPTTEGLYLRSIDDFEAKLIPGADGGSRNPFFSPDGQSIGYFSRSDQKLKKIDISGGAPVVICDTGPVLFGASWDSEESIVYSDLMKGGVFRVSAMGGEPELLIKGDITNINEIGFPAFPQMLPDGKTMLFTSYFDFRGDNVQVEVQSIETGERSILVKGGESARYLPTGHLVYGSTTNNVRNLLAVPFDLKRLEVGGQVSVLDGVVQGAAFSDSGVCVYVPQPIAIIGSDRATSPGRALVWVDRKGNESPLAADLDQYSIFKISPDGTRVAAAIGIAASSDIWILDLNRGNKSRLTFNESSTVSPIWTPDGQRIIYAYLFQRDPGYYLKKADGTGEAEKIFSAEALELSMPFSSSPDGKILAIWEQDLTTRQMDISILSMEGNQEKTLLLQEKYNETYPQISPDGRWMAFQSDETGRWEIYVHSFPDVNQGRWQVSTNGGDSPLWSPDGRELFYRSGDSFIAVEVETEPAFNPGKSEVLFREAYYSDSREYTWWDIHPDGDRFLLIKLPSVTAAEPVSQKPAVIGPRKINIVLNWFEELKERVPTP